jgi:hypothetical protein
MLVRLHSQATTTPKVQADIQASDEAAWVLAERRGTTELKIAATRPIAFSDCTHADSNN